MSTTPRMPPWVVRLIDDAAVFPPGLSPVDGAWADHLALRDGRYAECVGPLLIAPSHVDGLARAATVDTTPVPWDNAPRVNAPRDQIPPEHAPIVRVVLIAGSTSHLRELEPALRTLADLSVVQLGALEIVHTAGWESALTHALPLAVEVSRVTDDRDSALDELAETRGDGHAVIAKLRTQETADAPVPSASELAGFIVACRQRDLPFKLTGGLHHAVATVTVTETPFVREHGVVNVLLATHAARTGAAPAEIVHLLACTDGHDLAGRLLELSPVQQLDLRAAFTSYGCCGVLDPITELAALGLLPSLAARPSTPDHAEP